MPPPTVAPLPTVAPPPTTAPPPPPTSPGRGPLSPPTWPPINHDWLEEIASWWYQQTTAIKLGVAVAALLLFAALWRRVGGIVMEFISAAFLSLIIWVLLNLTRPVWQDLWQRLATPLFGGPAPDLALLLTALPLASWGLTVLLRSLRMRR
ncbi:MAG: hypothetical protein R3A44_42555 [Caldilineaceae bacterium]